MQTARLRLRPVTPADAPRIAILGGDWDVARMTGRIPYPYSEAAALHWVSGLAEGEIVSGIELDGALIGICGYSPAEGRSPGQSGELGYWIGKPYWGHGFAAEAAGALIEHGFTKAGIRRFTCSHFLDNLASARVAAKLGFQPTGSCEGWCEARRQHLPAMCYERRRTWREALRALV
mgnify:CR=1 FL=1